MKTVSLLIIVLVCFSAQSKANETLKNMFLTFRTTARVVGGPVAGCAIDAHEFVAVKTIQKVDQAKDEVIKKCAKSFGTGPGQLKYRKGLLLGMDPGKMRKSLNKLEPLDIILVGSTHQVNGELIPGYFQHAAVYVGSYENLIKMGLDKHPAVVKNLAKFKSAKAGKDQHIIIEARADGVVFNDISIILDEDYFGVFRYSELSDKERFDKMKLVMDQEGKGYDFLFDYEDDKEFSCSELPASTFLKDDIAYDDFVKENDMVTPNNIAEILLSDPTKFQSPLLMVGRSVIEPTKSEAGLGTLKHLVSSKNNTLIDSLARVYESEEDLLTKGFGAAIVIGETTKKYIP